ncbi:cytochrome c oxidase subunit 4 [Pontibacter sp. 172403-2]|uniref:cytochrome c oxidase subunit 4 n=1 Tax=Pontibacter rufus TaxID=2791028 RepID=UPI0018AFCE9F|nr:cytochrome c oxidase subunit 4 [Pontibacter sp. 172403-2]MBF9254044.1 cytochrome c oxidase subunit 4 [Pontibacter sp. 172403-2]
MSSQQRNETDKWVKAKPGVLPKPTYYPFFLALGLAFLGWGILLGWVVALAGLIIIVLALRGWINILRHEAKRDRH